MTVKFNSTGEEAQNMSSKQNKNKKKPKVCSV